VNNPVLVASPHDIKPATGLPFTGVVATFTDNDPSAVPGDFSASIDWGDGHTSAGSITNKISGGFNVRGTIPTIVDEAVSGETIVNGPVTESSAAIYYNLGEKVLNSNRRESAIAYFTESLRLDPRNPNAYYKRGLAYAQSSAAAPPEGPSQDQQRALGDFTEALLRCNRSPNPNQLAKSIYEEARARAGMHTAGVAESYPKEQKSNVRAAKAKEEIKKHVPQS
jgi:tetratricopeptide (TPR) repeat protein